MALNKLYCYGKASSLIEVIERCIGFDEKSGLIKDGSPEGVFLDTFENSSLGIAYVLQGRSEEAQRILRGIENYIGIDSETGLYYNKRGLSKDESKKVLSGEKALYLSNQALVSTLYQMLGRREKAKELRRAYEREIGTFEFEVNGKKYQIYRHGKNQDYFYPFNNLLVAINKTLTSVDQEDAEKLVADIKEICWDNEIGLLRAKPKDRVYFTLNNALMATYLAITGKEEAERIIKTVEDKIGFDEKTGLAFEGITPLKRIENVLTYANTQLAISYLALANVIEESINKIKNSFKEIEEAM